MRCECPYEGTGYNAEHAPGECDRTATRVVRHIRTAEARHVCGDCVFSRDGFYPVPEEEDE